MIYLKYYKLFESNDLKSILNKYINWNLIDDLKNLSLEYIDNGYKLYYDIYLASNGNEFIVNLLDGEFNHKVNLKRYSDYIFGLSEKNRDKKIFNVLYVKKANHWRSSEKVISEDGYINYSFILVNESSGLNINKKIGNELLAIIKSIYPNEYINLDI